MRPGYSSFFLLISCRQEVFNLPPAYSRRYLREEILRDEECPCGSKKKFKDCHMKNEWPREYFEIRLEPSASKGSTAVAYRDGKWEEMPGVSLAMTVYVIDPKYDYADVIDVIKPLSKLAHLQEYQRRLKHKLSAIRYHSDSFKKEEDDWIERYKTSITGGESCNVVEDNLKIIYEVEAFLFQVKSCLDVLNQLIRISFKLPYGRTYTNGGEALIRSLKGNCPKDVQRKRDSMISLIESSKRWILHTVEMRDEVTYDSDLIGFECFNQQARTGNFVRVFFPSMPNGRRTRVYLDTIWEKVLSLNRDVIKIIVS
jgi:hypothetical protein